MSGANASPTGRSHKEMSGANASPTRSASAIARSLKERRSNQDMSGANANPKAESNQWISEPALFKDLPATFPEKDRYKRPSLIGSILFHGMLILTVVLIPLFVHQKISERELWIALVSPIPPPPPPPPPLEMPAAVVSKPATPAPRSVVSDALIAPVAIPREIAKIVDEPIAPPPTGVIGGVLGGVPGGVISGVLGGVLAANSIANSPPVLAPPEPPPPPPKLLAPPAPVRVGGVVKEPRQVKLVPPVYPPLASRARISGTVVLEATLTAEGTVEQIRVVSGHPLLIDAAIDCVKQWIYEPTYLNGEAVPVILTARVHFIKAPVS